MKLPRSLSGEELIQKLKKFGYKPTRQLGSHIRLTTYLKEEHHITVPNHNPLRIGTLYSILKNVASHLQISKDELLDQLFK